MRWDYKIKGTAFVEFELQQLEKGLGSSMGYSSIDCQSSNLVEGLEIEYKKKSDLGGYSFSSHMDHLEQQKCML